MNETSRTETAEAPTCGQGLAAHAPVPGKVADFLNALADNLAAHVPTIDSGDSAGRQEKDAYESLVSELSATAARLALTADRMAGHRDLPAARHHDEALADPKLLDVFEQFVTIEAQLARLLRDSAERDRQFLREARSAES